MTPPADSNPDKARPERLPTPRIPPVPKEEWTPMQQEFLVPMDERGQAYNVFTTIAAHPNLARSWLTFARHVLRRNTLSPRDREILILRIGWLCQSEYEWAQHVRLGKEIGLTDDDVRRIQQGAEADGWSDHERWLVRAVDELHSDAFVSSDTWNALARTYDTRQMMDVVFTVGQYNLVSMALNSFGVQLDEGLVGFEK